MDFRRKGVNMLRETELNQAIKDQLKDIELALNESSIVAITDNKGVIEFANDRFCEISGYSHEELIGSRQNIVNSGYHSRAFFKEMWRAIGTGNVWKGKIKNRAKDGTYYWVDTTIVPFLKENGKPYRYISIRHDITKLKEYEEAISHMAYHDPLTALPNRNYLNEWMADRDIANDEMIACLFIDVDRFKSINDTFGHQLGDVTLLEVAKRIKASACANHFIVRQGGDEFIVFLRGLTSKDEVIDIVNDMIDKFSTPFRLRGENKRITISIGISMFQADSHANNNLPIMETLMKQANTAMFHAKEKFGNSYCFNTDAQNVEQDRYYLLENELKEALQKEEFHIVYQPLIHLKSKKLVGVEALLRWNNEKMGFVSPGEFIPILEELGGINDVGKWVLESVCRQLKDWYEKDIHIPRVAVNVSPVQFENKNFVQDVKKLIEGLELQAQRLELEITEGTIFHLRRAEEVFRELQEIGIRISIDDFGTGYSSLHRLKQLPINTLKIDRSFIDDLDSDGEVIVDTIISMGKTLHFNIVAEGIETEAQFAYLEEVGCDEGQGYYLGRPMSVEGIEEMYWDRNSAAILEEK